VIVAEAERQFYLEQAGIQLWYARDALPGAAASRSFLFGVSVRQQSLLPGAVRVRRPIPVKTELPIYDRWWLGIPPREAKRRRE